MLVQRLLSSGRQQILRGISFKQLKLTTPGFRYISSTRELPDKKPLKIGRLDKNAVNNSSALKKARQCEGITQEIGSTYGGNHCLEWADGPKNLLIVKKPDDKGTEEALVQIAKFIKQAYPNVDIILEREVAESFSKTLPFTYVASEDSAEEYIRTVDGVVTLGGDVPPVISFSMGTVGFLLPFNFRDHEAALSDFIESKISLKLRMRLECSLHDREGKPLTRDGQTTGKRQVMNEVNLHRGRAPHLTIIDTFVDGQYLTEAVADGLIVASPTGSTAYSLSAGGPIVHPSVQSLVLTPICPRSLSFRTVLLPSDATVQLRIGEKSRAPAEVSMDGRDAGMLSRGDYLQVAMSPYPIPCVNRSRDQYEDDWATDINDLLKWNASFENKRLLQHGM